MGFETYQTWWTQDEAIRLCRELSIVVPATGAFIGLTGGTLYKQGMRKDLDVLLYRCRQVDQINWRELYDTLHNIGIEIVKNHGFVKKAQYKVYNKALSKYIYKNIDILYPEHSGDCAGYTIEA